MERENYMRKNTKNEKVIRTMAIGISAMMMASSPLTALAAEGEGNSSEENEDKKITVTPEAGTYDEAKAAAEKADAMVGTAEDKTADVKNAVENGTEDIEGVKTGEVIVEVKGEDGQTEEKDLSQAVLDVSAKTEDTSVENGSSVKDAETAVKAAETELDVAEAKDKLSDAALNQATAAAADAEQTAAEAKDAMQEAQEKVDGQIEEIKEAGSVEEANAAYDEVKSTVEQAQADFDAKLGEYNTAKVDYEKAAEDLKKCEEDYNAAIASADANAWAAAEELARAQENAKELADALAAADKAVKDAAQGALDIAAKEKEAQEDNGLNWRNEDALFISIMKNYYLPKELGITGADVVRIQGEDNNTKNYFKVTYKDENGVDQTRYYNYLMDDKDAKGDQKDPDHIVIFEKRIEEVNWKDYRKDEDGNTVNIKEGIENGTVVKTEDGEYVQKTGEGVSETLVSDSEITGTSTEDVTVNEETNESWSVDDEGNLVKTVTADVTTINYTGKSLSGDHYASEEEAKEAAEAAVKDQVEKVAAKEKDITITTTEKQEDSTYVANGTYIPTFTKKVDVKDEEVEWDHTGKVWDDGVRTEEEAIAKVKEEQEKKLRNKINKDDDLYLISISSDFRKTGETEGTWYDDSDFLISGTVSATYAKVTKKTVDQSTFGSLWNDIKALFGKGEATNKKLEDAARKAVEAEGGIFVSANWDDWKFGKATIRYVAGMGVKTDEKISAEDARNAVQDAALAQEKERKSGATGVWNVNATGVDTIEHTSYSYQIDYLERGEAKTETMAIATETYTNAKKLVNEIRQNLNYYEDRILLTQKDEEYRNFVDSAKTLTTKYEKLLDKAQAAQGAVEAAQTEVDALRAEIEKLRSERKGNLEALSELEARLTVAEQNRQSAEETLNNVLDKLDEAGEELDGAIKRLTPEQETPVPENPGNNGETPADENPAPSQESSAPVNPAPSQENPAPVNPTPSQETPTDATPAPTVAEDSDDEDASEEQTVITPVILANAPAAPATVVAQNQAAVPQTVQIADEATPLAANAEESAQDGAAQTEGKEPEVKEAVTIADETVPLADVSVVEEHAKMSWWWLLIVLVLGATGYEMYRKHNEKKLKAQTENAENTEE